MATSFNVHTVSQGDTIQVLGTIYNVDWTQIVEVNGLEYPYIDTDITTDNQDKDGVAKLGSKLLIPSSGMNVPNKTNNSSQELERYSLGSDLDILLYSSSKVINIEDSGQLSDSHADVKLAEGLANLRQQLTTKLGTQKGSLLLHPNFGSNLLKFIGQRVTPELLTKIKLEVQECLLEDFRVEEVTDIKVVFKNHGVYVDCMIKPIPPYSAFSYSQAFYN